MGGKQAEQYKMLEKEEFLHGKKIVSVVENALTLQNTHIVLEEEKSLDGLLKCPQHTVLLSSSPSCPEVLSILELSSLRVWTPTICMSWKVYSVDGKHISSWDRAWDHT